MDTLGENQQIKVNFPGKRLINQIYLKCNLEKTLIFFLETIKY